MPSPAYAGSPYPATATPAPKPPTEAAPMPSAYCSRTVPYNNESPLGVAYRSLSVRADGSITPALWYDHGTDSWSETFDHAKHIRRLQADAKHTALQDLAVLGDMADDPSVTACVFTLKADGSTLTVVDVLPSSQLAVLARGFASNP